MEESLSIQISNMYIPVMNFLNVKYKFNRYMPSNPLDIGNFLTGRLLGVSPGKTDGSWSRFGNTYCFLHSPHYSQYAQYDAIVFDVQSYKEISREYYYDRW